MGIELHSLLLRELGFQLHQDSQVLDFGCGAGNTVKAYRAAGHNAFGCDIALPAETAILKLMPDGMIPFPDDFFDLVISESVLEHVNDYDKAASEIYRVLKPGGICVHNFPSRWRPIEPHVYVPLGCILRNYPWLAVWAILGVRNSFQRGQPWKEVAGGNRDYLRKCTHYLPGWTIKRHFARYFATVKFREDLFLRHSRGRASRLSGIPFIHLPYRVFHNKLLVASK